MAAFKKDPLESSPITDHEDMEATYDELRSVGCLGLFFIGAVLAVVISVISLIIW